MKMLLLLTAVFSIMTCDDLKSEEICNQILSDSGISISKEKSEEANFYLDIDISFLENTRKQPLFAYLKYSNNKDFLKVPVFLNREKDIDRIHYRILVSKESLKNLEFETFYYLPSGSEGIYLFVSGFSDISNLECKYGILQEN